MSTYHFHFPAASSVTIELPQNSAQLDRIEEALTNAVEQQGTFNMGVQEDLATIKQQQQQMLAETGAYIAERDRIDGLKDAALAQATQQIVDLTQQLAQGQIDGQTAAAGLKQIMADNQAVLDAIPDVPPPPVPVPAPAPSGDGTDTTNNP